MNGLYSLAVAMVLLRDLHAAMNRGRSFFRRRAEEAIPIAYFDKAAQCSSRILMIAESDTALATDAQGTLERARQLIASHQLASLPEAAELAERAAQVFTQLREKGGDEVGRALASALITRAKALREMGGEASRTKALPLYEKALEHLRATLDLRQPGHVNELASAWSQRGITLMDVGTAKALEEALACFDRAVDLRRSLPLAQQPFFRWGLAAALMNRADVQTRLGGPSRLVEALASYDEAIHQLDQMPPEGHASHRSRLSLAWMNRGLTCQALATASALSLAVESFGEAVALLRDPSTLANAEQRRLLACVLVNRGGTLLDCEPPQPATARKDALAAIRLAAEFERTELLSARMGLQARHLLCKAVAFIADTGLPGLPESEDWLTQTTDAVDEGLALARYWHRLGEPGLESLALDLFRFGSLVYAACQPHFLPEFLLDSLEREAFGADQAARDIAVDAMWTAARLARKRPADAAQQALLEHLKLGEVKLTALRERLSATRKGG